MKIIDKMRMVRPADALLPLAFLIASVLGKGDLALTVWTITLTIQCLGLASARGLRQAFSLQPSMRRVRGSVKAALLLQAAGSLALCLGYSALLRQWIPVQFLLCTVTGLLLSIEHVFYEYLYATGDGHSATLCRALTAALTMGGLMMTSDRAGGLLPGSMEWPLGAVVIASVVAAVISMAEGGLKGRLNDQVVRCAPLSLLHTALYPAAALCLMKLDNPILLSPATAAPLFAGLIVYELCRAPFRRAPMESRALNRALAVTGAAALAVWGLCRVPSLWSTFQRIMGRYAVDLSNIAVMVLLATICGFAMFGSLPGKSGDY